MSQADFTRQMEAARTLIAQGGLRTFDHYMHHWRDTELSLTRMGYHYDDRKRRWEKQGDPQHVAA